MKKPLVLCILDGVGIRKETHGNPVKQANMPTFNMLLKKYPHSLLEASGEAVGLPHGQMGNSEVGHTNIGTGRVVYQPLEIINQSIKDKSFFHKEELINLINRTKDNNSKLHVFGLLSDGGVHSHIDQLFSLLDVCKQNNIEKLYLHIFLDGRDTLKDKSITYIEKLEEKIKEINLGEIATISGRYYAMDRDGNYERIKKSYDVITNKVEEIKDYKKYIRDSYKQEIYDEFILPIQVNSNGIVEENDSLIIFNFRPDRLRELFGALTLPSFNKFETIKFKNIKLVTMFPVNDEIVSTNIFNHQNLENTFGYYIDKSNLKQLRIAETEKYAHVTYFFDGGKELDLNGAKRILIPSSKVKTYDLLPSMSAKEITDTLIEEMDKYDVVILNYANGDMVGHTGNIKAAIESLEYLDSCLNRLYKKIKEIDGTLIVTADHGNIEYMLDKDDNIITSHSTSKVPFIITNKKYKLKNGKLSDIAPTMLDILKLPKPKEMTGNSLIKKQNKKNIFMIISLIIFFSLLITYSIRFIHYYKLEHSKTIDNTLVTKIINTNELSTKTGLVIDGKEYLYKGKIENNYLYYSGILFRIIKINEDGSLKVITDDNITSLVWGQNNNYETSYIRKWLNENFYNQLSNKEYILEKDWCIDKIDKKIDSCKTKIKDNIGLLTYNEYMDVGANKSYLNINKYFWTINGSKDNKVWYVFNEGGISSNSNMDENYYSYGIRPVINLKPNINYIKGDGTKENPYIIDNNELTIGKYIKYSDYVWRVVSIDDSIKLVMNECLKENDKCLNKKYSNNNIYDTKNYYSIAYYLNNKLYPKLDKSQLVKGKWYTGSYDSNSLYDFKNIFGNNIETYVGLLNVTDLFNNKNSYTITPSNDLISTMKEDGTIYYSDIDEVNNIYPSIYINKNITIKEGTGLENDPFIIE